MVHSLVAKRESYFVEVQYLKELYPQIEDLKRCRQSSHRSRCYLVVGPLGAKEDIMPAMTGAMLEVTLLVEIEN